MFNRTRITRFTITGGIALLAYYLVYIGVTELGVHYLASSILGFAAYWTVHFSLNKFWTFESRGRGMTQASQHLVMHGVNHVLIMVGLYVMVGHFGVNYIVAQAILNVVTSVEVYLLSHYIFKK